MSLRVRVCAPSWWDLASPPAWPRVPGAVAVGCIDGADRVSICGGYLFCGACGPCQAGLHLACESPARPGWNVPGGLAEVVRLSPFEHLASVQDAGDDIEWSWVAAVLASAGATYQAVAAAGMAPGDTVVVFGDAGPGAIPLRVLAALGLRPIWITGSESPVPEVSVAPVAPDRSDLPSTRRHLLDISPGAAATPRHGRSPEPTVWSDLARGSVSCTFVGPAPPPSLSPACLTGQATLRWIRDLHPHLVLDLVALCCSGRLPPDPTAIETVAPDRFAAAFDALERGTATRWPVFALSSTRRR